MMRAAPLVLLVLAAVASGETPAEMRAISKAVERAVDRVAPSVVTIETYGGAPVVKNMPKREDDKPAPLVRPGVSPGPGPTTGVVLSADGWILSSAFAFVNEPTTIIVTLADGRALTAKLHGRDMSRGIALLKVEATGLPVPEFAPPVDTRVGMWAVSVGRGLSGERPMVQIGIVSAVDRISGRAIQTDALTSPANFGGPLLDLRERVLGILVPLSRRGLEAAVRSYDSGIGFAVPVAGILPHLDRLKAGEVLHGAFLGVGVDQGSVDPGARVTRVVPDSAAAKANLAKGDVILSIEGRELPTAFALLDAIGRHLAGERVTIRYRRGDETKEIEVELTKRPDRPPPTPVEKDEEDDEKPGEEPKEPEKDGGR